MSNDTKKFIDGKKVKFILAAAAYVMIVFLLITVKSNSKKIAERPDEKVLLTKTIIAIGQVAELSRKVRKHKKNLDQLAVRYDKSITACKNNINSLEKTINTLLQRMKGLQASKYKKNYSLIAKIIRANSDKNITSLSIQTREDMEKPWKQSQLIQRDQPFRVVLQVSQPRDYLFLYCIMADAGKDKVAQEKRAVEIFPAGSPKDSMWEYPATKLPLGEPGKFCIPPDGAGFTFGQKEKAKYKVFYLVHSPIRLVNPIKACFQKKKGVRIMKYVYPLH